jgi:hypothetical protein
MKKFIVSILAVLYLSTSMGATIQLHYCMGKLVDWGVWHNSSSKCSNCGMEKNHKGCCKDEYKQLKNDKDQKLSENFAQLNKPLTEIVPVSFQVYSVSLPFILSHAFTKANAPPRSCNTPLGIMNCVFRI